MIWLKRVRIGWTAVLVSVFVALTILLIRRPVRFIRVPVSTSVYCPSDQLASQEDPGQLALYFKPRPHPVNEPISKFLIQPHPRICNSKLDLLMIVPSPPGAVVVRDAIRQTWGSVVTKRWPHAKIKGTVALVFLLGKEQHGSVKTTALKQESDAHGDLLIGDFLDSYRNLTLKVLTGLNWVSMHCSRRVSYVLKVDLDSFVNVERLLNILSQLQPTGSVNNVLLGELLCSEQPRRDRSSKVYVDPSLYPFAVYPPYVRGGSYVLPGKLVTPLVNASRYMPFLPVEDAFINGILARTLNVQHMHVPGVMSALVCSSSPCVFLATGEVTATNAGPEMMQTIWEDLQKGPQHCQNHPSLWSRACITINSYWSRLGHYG